MLLAIAAVLLAACGHAESAATLTSDGPCELVADSSIQAAIGSASAELFIEDTLSECTWSGPGGTVALRAQSVPDPALFVEHSIDDVAPERVLMLDELGQHAVLFTDEAALGTTRIGIVLITGSIPDSQLVSLLDEALESFE